MPKFYFNDIIYNTDDLGEKAQGLTTKLTQMDERLGELKKLQAVLKRARREYISDLKREVLSAKAGLEFSND